jgi:hypothetical protein
VILRLEAVIGPIIGRPITGGVARRPQRDAHIDTPRKALLIVVGRAPFDTELDPRRRICSSLSMGAAACRAC